MSSKGCLIVGGSHAAAQLVASLRQEGWQESITVISDSPLLPYQRPPLSKGFLAQKVTQQQLLIRPESAYQKHDIQFRLNSKVAAIDRHAHRVTLATGEQLEYAKLALCTGARARHLEICGADLQGVHYLRDLTDVETIQHDLSELAGPPEKINVVLVGGGYIGLETAASLRSLGYQVTVIEAAPRILQRVTAAPVAEFFAELHQAHGVKLVTQKQVAELMSRDGQRVDQVVCTDGSHYSADCVIVGIGVRPNIELAEQAGIDVSNGILVNEYAQTNDPDIVAAGDCTFHRIEHYDLSVRLESVPNAMEQAKSAAASICGKQKAYTALPWFWSDQYDIKLQIAGLNHGYEQTVVRQNQSAKSALVVWYFKQDHLIAADCINSPKEFMLAKQLIARNIAVTPEQLIDPEIDLAELLNV